MGTDKLTEAEWIWKDGEFVRWRDATVHLLSLAVQFGSSVFEGIRCYRTARGPAIFRLDDHLRRLEDSCRIYRIEVPFTRTELAAACTSTVARNGLADCYLRPVVLRGYGAAGMNPIGSPIETYVAAWPWGAYLGADAAAAGVDVCVSNWLRPHPNTFPAQAKAAGHYTNAQLIKMSAVTDGYAEAIALAPDGTVSEGSGQNLFLVRDGALVTPPIDGSALNGITRDTVLVLAHELGIPAREQKLPREALYGADELFYTGTATEIAPIRSVDRITIGSGARGPITQALQERFGQLVRGELPDPREWLAYVEG